MKKYLIGFVMGAMLVLPAGAFAWSQRQMAQPIVGADCNGPYYANDKGEYTDASGKNLGVNDEPVIDPKGTDGRCSTTVYRFTDNGHTCYLVKGTNAGGIDCL